MDQPERVRYFDQQFLRVDDFNAEQIYHRDMRRRHNRMLHTPGISEGLQLVPAGTAVKVTPGAAVAPGADGNGGGAEIVLTTEFTQDLSSFNENVAVFVTIGFAQEESRPVNDAGFTANSRWRETPKIEVFTSDPTANPPASQTQPLRVLLGSVTRTGKNVTAIQSSGRRLAGSAESELSLTPRDPTILEPDWVRLRWTARGQAELRGNLALVASQSTTGDLSVAGKAIVSTDLTVFGKAGVTGELKVGGKLIVSGDLAVTGTTLSSGALTVGATAARQRLTVFGDAVVNRALMLMGNTDGGAATAGKVLGGLGFLGHTIQHGQLSFRAGSGFELVDRSVDSPTLDYALDSRPYADLRVRNLFAVNGTIRASNGSTSASGLSFVGSSVGEEGFVRYESGDEATLVIGCANDANDRVELHQAGARRLTVHNGNIGLGTRTPAAKLDVAGDVAINGKLALKGHDAYLRLNQNGQFANGVHAPCNFTASSINIGGRQGWDASPGSGNAWMVGRCIAGPSMIGDVGHGAGWAGFCHEDSIGKTNYGLLHSADGTWTLLNKASGVGRIEFRVDNGTRLWMDDAGNMCIKGNLGTHNYDPTPRTAGWGGGLRTLDVEAEGSVWSRNGLQTGNRDLAETFACDAELEAGDVVVLDGERDVVSPCRQANDGMVLGVVSERPGFLLGARPEGPDSQAFAPVALAGRVPCKVTTANGPIVRGALLTASDELGRAMRADPIELGGEHVFRSGTIIGKALESCDAPSGTIEIVVLSR
jgi:hypothetical protein